MKTMFIVITALLAAVMLVGCGGEEVAVTIGAVVQA